jgi:hypothetical protein
MSILQKIVASLCVEAEARRAMKRSAIHLGLIGAFIFAIVLSVSPNLHERFHPDAKQAHHECAVTFIAAGNYDHAAPPPLFVRAFLPSQISDVATLSPVWVPSPFSSARIFEHAPPVCA